MGAGDPRLPAADPAVYPPMATLLAELARQHLRVERAWLEKLQGKDQEGPKLTDPLAWRYGEVLPTLGDAALFLAISHEAMHLGQLAAWRRARGLSSALTSL